jgi:hypothetical protein
MKIKVVLIPLVLAVLAFNSCVFISRQATLAALAKERFTVNINSPNVEAGEIEAQFNRAFPLTGVAKHDISVAYYPFEDAVCLQFKSNTVTYNQFWDRKGRDSFITALKKYNEDFTNQKLRNRNSNKTKNLYGKIDESYLVWYTHRFSLIYRGNMEVELGYYFKDGSPFFAVTLLEALYKSPSLDAEKDEYSPIIPIFFTRAQAEELAETFDQEFLMSLVPEEYLQILNRNANRRTDDAPDFDSL